MADPQYNETVDPKNPPNSVVRPGVRSRALATYLGGLIVFFLIVGAAWIYWGPSDDRRTTPDEEAAAAAVSNGEIGTTGATRDREEPGLGGFNPDPKPGDTRDELEYRGAGEPPQGPMPGLASSTPLNELGAVVDGPPRNVAGRRVDVQDVNVVSVQGNSFVVQDGNARVTVVTTSGQQVQSGRRVNISGVVEPDGNTVRIRASRVTIR